MWADWNRFFVLHGENPKLRTQDCVSFSLICNMKINLTHTILLSLLPMLMACKAYKHGASWSKAIDTYQLQTGDADNFGDQRLEYNKAFHNHSALSNFHDCNCDARGLPNFIYEYKSPAKCRGIKLFYTKLDSVFVFEEPKPNKLQSIQVDGRKMNAEEWKTYEKLKTTR